jgi:acyl-CoA synthetase (AMP-forming)/AMP-acid ligase II
MGPATFVIAILGCADGGTACTPVATLSTQYVTQAQCTAATGAALLENSDFDYPTLLARCRTMQPKAASAAKDIERQRRG